MKEPNQGKQKTLIDDGGVDGGKTRDRGSIGDGDGHDDDNDEVEEEEEEEEEVVAQRKTQVDTKKGLCRNPGLNQGPLDLQSNALPTELFRQW